MPAQSSQSPGSAASRWVSPAEVTTAVDTRAALRSRRIILDELNSRPTVCAACQRIFTEAKLVAGKWQLSERSWRGIGQLHRRVEDIYRAADDGCYICDYITESAGATRVTDYMIQSGLWEDTPLPKQYLLLIVAYKKRPPKMLHILVERAGPEVFSSGFDQISAAQSSTASPESIALAKRWLETCRNEHPECRRVAGPRWYPTRLLRLTGGSARLIITGLQSLDEPYATLSHCWGAKPFANLTSASFVRFEKGIPVTEFLPTFRHTMEICLNLGIRLLWIDCFCIIQGQDAAAAADWEVESVRMEQVYANGCVNIAAAGASGPDDGCYFERRPRPPTPFIRCPASATDRMVLQKTGQGSGAMRHNERRQIRGERLWSRAWVFQERLVCRRLLQFGARELRWDCVKESATEFARREHEGLLGPDFFRRHANQEDPEEPETREPNIYSWMQVVSDYTKKSLTYPAKDKLRALQAATDRAERLFHVTLHYGHTVQQMLVSLTWMVSRSSRPGFVTNETHARIQQMPSWSWASLDGPITYGGVFNQPMRTTHALATIILPQMASSGHIRYHRLKDHALFCIGRVLPAHLLGQLADVTKGYQRCRVGTSAWEIDAQYDCKSEAETVWREGARLWLFALCPCWTPRHVRREQSSDGEPIRGLSYYVLVLSRNVDGTFRRFGISVAEVVSLREKHYSGRFQGYQLDRVNDWYEAYRKTSPTVVVLV